ncbi:MAG: NUDIX domain-containing protein [Allosphingosinicella sp.]
MGFEPQKFFIGLVDFFSVWLPGAILAFLVKDAAAPALLGSRAPGDVEAWALFLFGSYLAGHFIFLLGSELDRIYDRIRAGHRDGQIRRLAEGRRRSWITTRGLARVMLKPDRALPHVLRLKARRLGPAGAATAINAYQWCKSKLALGHPDALALVDRFEADSKFFRSLCIVLLTILLWQLWILTGFTATVDLPLPPVATPTWPNAALAFLLLLLAFWRYVERRSKAIGQAYRLMLTLQLDGNGPADLPLASAPKYPGRAGGLVVRRRQGRLELLLVASTRKADQWVLPKGHVEPGESEPEAAVREVLEETPHWARVHEKLGDIEFVLDREPVCVRFFLMEGLGRARRMPEGLRRWWRMIPGWVPDRVDEAEARPSTWVDIDRAAALLRKESADLVGLLRDRLRPG